MVHGMAVLGEAKTGEARQGLTGQGHGGTWQSKCVKYDRQNSLSLTNEQQTEGEQWKSMK
jgi:hypothetical protein